MGNQKKGKKKTKKPQQINNNNTIMNSPSKDQIQLTEQKEPTTIGEYQVHATKFFKELLQLFDVAWKNSQRTKKEGPVQSNQDAAEFFHQNYETMLRIVYQKATALSLSLSMQDTEGVVGIGKEIEEHTYGMVGVLSNFFEGDGLAGYCALVRKALKSNFDRLFQALLKFVSDPVISNYKTNSKVGEVWSMCDRMAKIQWTNTAFCTSYLKQRMLLIQDSLAEMKELMEGAKKTEEDDSEEDDDDDELSEEEKKVLPFIVDLGKCTLTILNQLSQLISASEFDDHIKLKIQELKLHTESSQQENNNTKEENNNAKEENKIENNNAKEENKIENNNAKEENKIENKRKPEEANKNRNSIVKKMEESNNSLGVPTIQWIDTTIQLADKATNQVDNVFSLVYPPQDLAALKKAASELGVINELLINSLHSAKNVLPPTSTIDWEFKLMTVVLTKQSAALKNIANLKH